MAAKKKSGEPGSLDETEPRSNAATGPSHRGNPPLPPALRKPRKSRAAAVRSELRPDEGPASSPRAPATGSAEEVPRAPKKGPIEDRVPGTDPRKSRKTWPESLDRDYEIAEEDREQAEADLAYLLTHPPGGWDLPIYPDTMMSDGKNGRIALVERVVLMVRSALGPESAAGAVGVPRALFWHWCRIGNLARSLYGQAEALNTPAAKYAMFVAELRTAKDAGEAKLLFHWATAAQTDWRAAASLARYTNPKRFAPENQRGLDPELALPPGPGHDGRGEATNDGPIRFYIPAEENLVQDNGPEEVIETTGTAVEDMDLDEGEG